MSLNLAKQKSLLEAKKAELEKSIALRTEAQPTPVSSTEVNAGPWESEEVASDFIEMQKEQSLLVNQQSLLTLVDQALQRLLNGTYGLCQECGLPIPQKRLEAIPWADRDIACEEALERRNLSREEVYGAPQTF
jgi:DnaK suppressor protein